MIRGPSLFPVAEKNVVKLVIAIHYLSIAKSVQRQVVDVSSKVVLAVGFLKRTAANVQHLLSLLRIVLMVAAWPPESATPS